MDSKIEFRRERTIGQCVNDTFNFLRNEWKPLLKFLTVGVMGLGLLDMILTISGFYALGFIGGVLSFVIKVSFINYIIVTAFAYIDYYEKGWERFTIKELLSAFKYGAGPLSILAFLIGIILVILLFILSFVGAIFWNFSPYVGVPAIAGIVFLLLFIITSFSLAFPVMYFERPGTGASLGRSINLLNGSIFRATGGILVISLINLSVTIVFSTPLFLTGFDNLLPTLFETEAIVDSSNPIAILLMLLPIFSNVFIAIGPIFLSFLYFSKLEERQGSKLINDIDKITDQNK